MIDTLGDRFDPPMKNRPSVLDSKLSGIFLLYSFVILIVVNVLWFIDEEFHQLFAGWLFNWGLTNNSCKPPKDSLAIWHQRVIEFSALQVWESKLATNRTALLKFASCISELLKSPPVRSTSFNPTPPRSVSLKSTPVKQARTQKELKDYLDSCFDHN